MEYPYSDSWGLAWYVLILPSLLSVSTKIIGYKLCSLWICHVLYSLLKSRRLHAAGMQRVGSFSNWSPLPHEISIQIQLKMSVNVVSLRSRNSFCRFCKTSRLTICCTVLKSYYSKDETPLFSPFKLSVSLLLGAPRYVSLTTQTLSSGKSYSHLHIVLLQFQPPLQKLFGFQAYHWSLLARVNSKISCFQLITIFFTSDAFVVEQLSYSSFMSDCTTFK